VASVDLAHVGPKYGGKERVDAAALDGVLRADRSLIERAVARDPAGWLRLLHEEGDRRNVCGAAAAWLLLSVLEGDGPPGRLLRHDAWEIDPATGSHVSFCAIAYGR
jgi:hypothetical protein